MTLPWADIQGNIFPGFRKDHQAFLFVRFQGGSAKSPSTSARSWLDEVRRSVASAEEVQAFNDLFRVLRKNRPGRELEAARATWVNLGLSYQGLQKLGAMPDAPLPPSFTAGMYGRADELGDVRAEMPGWLVGGSAKTEADAVVLLAADSPDDLKREIARQRSLLSKYRQRIIALLQGASLGNGREHFGFRDGIAQPTPVERADLGTVPDGVLAGEFLLGADRDPHGTDPDPPPWAINGSYLVIRRLRQDVAGFHATAAAAAEYLSKLAEAVGGKPISSEVFEARCLGRWPDGTPTTREPAPDGTRPSYEVTAQELRDDPAGLKMPRFAHVRKVHPVDRAEVKPEQHRILRRGITYGPALPPGAPDDGADRGLIFLAYQASLAEQFELITRDWMNARLFPALSSAIQVESGDRRSAGEDPITGVFKDDRAGPRTVWCPVNTTERNGRLIVDAETVTLPRIVTMTGGGYFLCPSISALAMLAQPTTTTMTSVTTTTVTTTMSTRSGA
jgi:Dyp-type peroxidase family